MAESYANNQWYNLQGGVSGPNSEGGLGGLARTPKDNPEFLFPGKVRRNLAGGPDQIVQRGFMRSLLTEIPDIGDSIPNRRFFFQFNPERIMRSVSLSSGLMNPLLQEPGQFSVATPGNATFSFDITLNREMEVNNATVGMTDSSPLLVGQVNPLLQDPAPTGVSPKDVGQIGVLADLMVMDSIIGQGISDDIITALAQITSKSSTWDTADTSSGASVNSNFISEKKASDAFKSIMGNSAFLVSTPVRIVFSSMFMVDGFIQSSSVNFTKFNTNMVPTICGINVTVEAKYIGFAKKDTYLSETLKAASVNPQSTNVIPDYTNPEQSGEAYLLEMYLKNLPKYQVALAGTNDDDRSGSWTKGDGNAVVRQIIGFDTVLMRYGFDEDVRKDITKNDNPSLLSQAYVKGKSSITIEHDMTIRIWASYEDDAEKTQAINFQKTRSGQPPGPGKELVGLAENYSNKRNNNNSDVTVSRDVLLLEIAVPIATCTDYSTWIRNSAFGGGSNGGLGREWKTLDDAHDKLQNHVWTEAGASKDTAKQAYLTDDWLANKGGLDYAHGIDVLVDININVYGTISNLSTAGKPSTRSLNNYFTYQWNISDNFLVLPKLTTKY